MTWKPQTPIYKQKLIESSTDNILTGVIHYIDIPFIKRTKIKNISIIAKYKGVYDYIINVIDINSNILFRLGKGTLYRISDEINKVGKNSIEYIHDGQEKITIRVNIYNRTGTSRNFDVITNYDTWEEEIENV